MPPDVPSTGKIAQPRIPGMLARSARLPQEFAFSAPADPYTRLFTLFLSKYKRFSDNLTSLPISRLALASKSVTLGNISYLYGLYHEDGAGVCPKNGKLLRRSLFWVFFAGFLRLGCFAECRCHLGASHG